MKISDRFQLNCTQYDLDFVNVNTSRDIPLFLNPHVLSQREDDWSYNASSTIRNFFQHLLNLLKSNDTDEAWELFSHLDEPNEVCLGMSKGEPRGRGAGESDAVKIFERILQSKAIQTGLVEDLEDSCIFVEGVGPDKLSDMTANIIRRSLIDYTIQQADFWQIPLQDNAPSGLCWNTADLVWEQFTTRNLIINERRILLVPKAVVTFSKAYTPEYYFNFFVLHFLQQKHLRLQTSLVKRSYKKGKVVREWVTKKDVRAHDVGTYSKEYLRKFTLENPEVYQEYKKQEIREKAPANELLTNELLFTRKQELINELKSIPPGSDNANMYHNLVMKILEVVFYPKLLYPRKEVYLHEGRKRIDITYTNAQEPGFFTRLQMPSMYIMVECKNYTHDPKNPELDQLIGRFSPHRSMVGLMLCRTLDDMDTMLKRCSDTYYDNNGLIIPLTDTDIISVLDQKMVTHDHPEEELLEERRRRILFRQ